MNAILKLILQENNDKGNNKPSSYNFLLILLEFKSFCGDILSHFNVQIWEQPIGQTLSYKKNERGIYWTAYLDSGLSFTTDSEFLLACHSLLGLFHL